MGCGGVDRIVQAAEVHAGGLELLDHGEQVDDRAGEAIEPHGHQGLAGADIAQQAGKDGAAADRRQRRAP